MVRAAVKEQATASAVKHRLVGTIGSMTDALVKLREKKRELEAKIGEIEAEYGAIEGTLMDRLGEEGLDKGTGKLGTVSISETMVGNVTDWDAVNAFVKKTGNFQLFQRRLSDPAFRELLELGKKVPGVEQFTKKRLNLRANT